MPRNVKLEGSGACPQITPLSIPPGEYATVRNISDHDLAVLSHWNDGNPMRLPTGETALFTQQAFLVSYQTTEVEVSYTPLATVITLESVEPTPFPEPAPEPEPTPAPEPTPEPAPAPAPEPVPEPTPVDPAPVVTEPVPEPVAPAPDPTVEPGQ